MVYLVTLLSTAILATSLIPSVVVAVPIQSSASEEGLVEREPSHHLHGYAASPIRGSVSARHKRELTDLVQRSPEPWFHLAAGLAVQGISALSKLRRKRRRDLSGLASDELELNSRADHEELAMLMARDPEYFLQVLDLATRDLSSVDYEDAFERDFDQPEDLEMREVEDIEEFEMREDNEDEMAARGWTELEELD
ncbi:hypothetical protein BKA70DRAFT_1567995 [Coprinopsis sp. MPI-PUGE-AT-0042]|nr:hypothetical protein BKA70DRAFT_1567995 [Coprinopsis sp. MPI-PUGE-AT-0042]